MMKIEDIACICHEANRTYCETLGDTSQFSWDKAPTWQKQSTIKGVEFIIDNPDAPPSASHESWLIEKGWLLKDEDSKKWKYAPIKNVDKKEHPCFVPYNQLPLDQRRKDYIFGAIVRACLGAK